MSRLGLKLEPKAAARRIEVITGGGGRRRWSDDEKARAIEASLVPGAVVSAVARRHGVTPQELFTWRREARRKAADTGEATPFVPAIVEVGETGHSSLKRAADPVAARPPIIELDIDGSSVWIWRGADATMVTAIVHALKARK